MNIYIRIPAIFLLLIVFLPIPAHLSARTASHVPSTSQVSALEPAPLHVAPDALSATLTYGTSQDVQLTLSSESDTPLVPHFYEAKSAPASDIVPGPVVPEQLRRVALPAQPERVDPQIDRDLAASAGGDTEFLIFLRQQPDLSAAYAIDDWNERGQFVYRTLHDSAERSQREVRAWLEQRGLAYRPFWIVNAIAVRGSGADVQALASRADIALLRANYTTSLAAGAPLMSGEQATVDHSAVVSSTANVEWHVRKVGADRVWAEFGITGEGITVANIDSGVQYDHPALLHQYRGYHTAQDIQHEYNWFDPSDVSDEPSDQNGHGTHVMGIMTGRGSDNEDQPAVGLAPGARWIAARGCRSNTCLDADLIAAAQWLLAPTDTDGENPRPDLRPHIINNSWAGGSNDDFYLSYVTAWRAAGIFPVFVVGNEGSSRCSTVAAPGEYANVVAVGSTNSNDVLSSFSGTGPSIDGVMKPEITAPGDNILSSYTNNSYTRLSGTSMAAPHVAAAAALLWSANPALIGDYDETSTLLTSTALPRTDERFADSRFAACHADSVPNNIYGHGRLDTYTAVSQASVDIPWLHVASPATTLEPGAAVSVTLTFDARSVPGPGTYEARLLVGTGDLSQSPQVVELTLTVEDAPDQAIVNGHIRDRLTGQPLSGAVEIDNRLRIETDADGFFATKLYAREEPYTISTSVIGYVSQSIEVRATTSITRSLEFELLADIPRLSIGTTPTVGLAQLDPVTATLAYAEEQSSDILVWNSGSQTLNYTAKVPYEQYGIWRSDEPGGPSSGWIAMPASSTPITLEDDTATLTPLPLGFSFPFNGTSYSSIYVSANGILSFDPLPSRQLFSTACMPVPETSGTALVPLRADLDVSQGGRVRWAQLDEGFVVSYEEVPWHRQATDTSPPEVYTFQVLLTRDGRILFTYGALGDLPGTVGVGVQFNSQNWQKIGCGKDAPISSYLTLELRPQPNAQQWMTLAGTVTAGLIPEQQATIIVTVKGVLSGVAPRTYRSAVVFESNDTRQPSVRLPVQISVGEAPHILFLPAVVR